MFSLNYWSNVGTWQTSPKLHTNISSNQSGTQVQTLPSLRRPERPLIHTSCVPLSFQVPSWSCWLVVSEVRELSSWSSWRTTPCWSPVLSRSTVFHWEESTPVTSLPPPPRCLFLVLMLPSTTLSTLPERRLQSPRSPRLTSSTRSSQRRRSRLRELPTRSLSTLPCCLRSRRPHCWSNTCLPLSPWRAVTSHTCWSSNRALILLGGTSFLCIFNTPGKRSIV